MILLILGVAIGGSVDSMKHAAAVKVALPAQVLTHPETVRVVAAVHDTVVRVALPEPPYTLGWGVMPAHVIGWLVTIAGFVAAGGIAVRGWKAAASISRDAQQQRRQIEENRRKAQLILRTRAALETIAVTARSILKKDPKSPINPEVMNGVLVEWRRYDRVSDDLDILGSPSLEDRLERVLAFSRMCAEKIMEDERRFRETRDKLGEVRPEGLYVDQSIIRDIEDHRGQLYGLVKRMGAEAQALLEEFNGTWPPRTGHEERSVPESTAGDPTPTLPGPPPWSYE